MSLLQLIKLCRPQQWYKNFLVFLPLIFVGKLFDTKLLLLSIAGFVALSFMSSTNYILNDLFDMKKDRLNSEKKNRPLASGKLKLWQALIVAFALFVSSLWIASNFSNYFMYSLLFLFVATLWYSILLKKEVILDILMIGINFITRSVSGTFLIHVSISPWLVLCTFFLSLFLSTAKRQSELSFLGQNAQSHRASLKKYTPQLTNALIIITTSLLIVSYSLYSFLSNYKYLFFTIPFALYIIVRYLYLAYSGSEIARHPEKAVKDWKLVLGMILLVLLDLFIIYEKEIAKILVFLINNIF